MTNAEQISSLPVVVGRRPCTFHPPFCHENEIGQAMNSLLAPWALSAASAARRASPRCASSSSGTRTRLAPYGTSPSITVMRRPLLVVGWHAVASTRAALAAGSREAATQPDLEYRV